MAYIDTSKIEDIHAKNIITKSPDLALSALERAEAEAKEVANSHNILSENIPVDDSGFLTSPSLYNYTYNWFLFYLFRSVGGAFEQDDIYNVKALQAREDAMRHEKRLTYSTIMNVQVTDRVKRSQGIPVL